MLYTSSSSVIPKVSHFRTTFANCTACDAIAAQVPDETRGAEPTEWKQQTYAQKPLDCCTPPPCARNRCTTHDAIARQRGNAGHHIIKPNQIKSKKMHGCHERTALRGPLSLRDALDELLVALAGVVKAVPPRTRSSGSRPPARFPLARQGGARRPSPPPRCPPPHASGARASGCPPMQSGRQ